jgi:hypothetical protein
LRAESSQLRLKRRREGFDDAKSDVVKVDAEWNYQILLRIATPVNVACEWLLSPLIKVKVE